MHRSNTLPARGQEVASSSAPVRGLNACSGRRAPRVRRRADEVHVLPRDRVVARVAEDTRTEPSRNRPRPAFNTISSSMDYDVLFSDALECPLGGVAEVMRSNERGILTCSPQESLEAVVPRLSTVTGLPVLNIEGRVVGVISRKDIIRVRKAQGSLLDKVQDHMTTPAITIEDTASVQDAADVMLSRKIRRLPVVNQAGYPVGILARSDIFKPLFMEDYTEYMYKEVEALKGLTGQLGLTEALGLTAPTSTTLTASPTAQPQAAKKTKKKITWAVKYLYDGDCAMCQSLKKVLERQDNGKGKIKFVNIASPDYNPSKNMGIDYDEAMETIHVLRPDGEVLYGTDALRAMFNEVGLGWAANLSESPLLAKLVDIVYNFLSANRISLGGALDAIIVAKRVEMSKAGIEVCSDVDEECKVEW